MSGLIRSVIGDAASQVADLEREIDAMTKTILAKQHEMAVLTAMLAIASTWVPRQLEIKEKG